MVTYEDYFSRKTLYNCGISPNEKMFKNDERAYTGMQRTEKIRAEMSGIYQTLYRGYTKNSAVKGGGNFSDLHVERGIVSAFYDSGILNNAERDYFHTQTLSAAPEREKIYVGEANALTETSISQRVDAPTKTPLARDIRQ